MPKKATHVNRDLGGRQRITVELDNSSADKLEGIITVLNNHRLRRVSISQVVRAALKHFHENGDWSSAAPF